ncbi:hypothetical protein KCU83_g204, partial [Aureobasidium melanogenum]
MTIWHYLTSIPFQSLDLGHDFRDGLAFFRNRFWQQRSSLLRSGRVSSALRRRGNVQPGIHCRASALPLWVLQSWYVVLDASDLHQFLLLAHEIYLQQIFIDVCEVDGPRYEGLDLGDIFLKSGSQIFVNSSGQGMVVSTMEDPFLDRLGAVPLALGVRLGFLPPSCVLVGTVVSTRKPMTDCRLQDFSLRNSYFGIGHGFYLVCSGQCIR